jgi:hypothetical protein
MPQITGGVILEESFLIRRPSLNFNKPALAPAAAASGAAGQGFLRNDRPPTNNRGITILPKFLLILSL